MRLVFIVMATLVVSAGTGARADEGSARHLLAGVHAFKEGRYEEALVELRIVQHSADAPADLAFYLGPTLYKLGRHREALAVFVGSGAPRDALTELYLGQTFYQLRLYRRARRSFAPLQGQGLGPALEDAAQRYVVAIDRLYASPPSVKAIDAYLADGVAVARAGEPLVAAEYFEEAREVEAFGPTPYRRAEIRTALAAARNDARQSAAVIELLAAEPSLPPEAAIELARAYIASGQPARARPLLEPLATGSGAIATKAAALLAKLAP